MSSERAGLAETSSPTTEEFRAAGHEIIDWIAHYLEHSKDYPVLAQVRPGGLTDALPARGPEQGEPLERLFADFKKQVLPAITHWNHPRFFAYFPNSATAPGILGELLAAALNVNGMLWKSSPAVTELEQVSLGWLRDWLGLPDDFFGLIYDTASISTLHALAAAREVADPEARRRGNSAGMVVYASEQAHSSVEKSCILLGLGQDNFRKIATDERFRMDPQHLEQAISQDLAAGRRPLCVVATVGTTSTTSVDPVPEIADICERYSIWLHVDGAYGGATGLVPEFRPYLDGVSRAQSFVVNPHKWLLTPVDCSALYTREPEALERAFSLIPEYLKTAHDPRAINLMDYGIQLGRRFRALKLWFAMRAHGREGMTAMVRSHVGYAQDLRNLVAADARFEVVAPTPMSVLCFRLLSCDEQNRALLNRVNDTGKAFLSHTVLRGNFVLRLAIGNFATTWDDVAATWDLIQREAAALTERAG